MGVLEGEFDSDSHFCISHALDRVLVTRLEPFVSAGDCSFCSARDTQVVNIGRLAEVTYEVVSRNYLTNQSIESWDNEVVQELVEESVVYESLESHLSDDYAISICDAVEVAFNYSDGWWLPDFDRGEVTTYAWQKFVEIVKYGCRVPIQADPNSKRWIETDAEYLHRVLSSLVLVAHDELALVIEQDSDVLLYRARAFEDANKALPSVKKDPAKELGPAPGDKSGAGRMNAQGVSLFYASLTKETAAAESLRHSHHDEVIVGEFKSRRSLTLLDLTAEPAAFSPFGDKAGDLQQVVEFLAELKNELMQPVPLDGNEAVRYAPTQLVTDFLRWSSPVHLDGILFPSRAHKSGKNLILFFGPDKGAIENIPQLEPVPELPFSFDSFESPLLSLPSDSLTCYKAERTISLTATPDAVPAPEFMAS